MNDILKLEMLMIEVTTLNVKLKYFNILCTCGGMKEIYFFWTFYCIVNGIIQTV